MYSIGGVSVLNVLTDSDGKKLIVYSWISNPEEKFLAALTPNLKVSLSKNSYKKLPDKLTLTPFWASLSITNCFSKIFDPKVELFLALPLLTYNDPVRSYPRVASWNDDVNNSSVDVSPPFTKSAVKYERPSPPVPGL